MDASRWQRLQELFERALELPPGDRAAWLESACADDIALRRQAESLISHSEEHTGIGEAIGDAAASLIAPQDPVEGGAIGPYRILRLLGRGGMGAVYLAQRDDEHFTKTVAIKLIQSTLPIPEIIARFKAERQILARLDHPNIARLLDGGAAPNGAPYFVIEYVDGAPVTDYCRERQLSLGARLRLFRKICAAVHYSHQNLVIHRDLKPGNIFVGPNDEPKLLDFGIAKLLDPTAGAHTQTQARLMTPDYASPEQVRGEPVTTATDVYALGVLLYELLTGQRPYRVTAASQSALEQAICDSEPERPSTLRRELRGDLENIILMAMRKDPARRYASAEQLSEDIRRYLEGYPVQARQESWSYSTAKFVRRNRAAVAGAAAAFLLTIALAAAMTIQAGRIARERDAAALERKKAEQVSEFLASLFRVADPGSRRGESVTVREVLDEGARRIERDLAAQPEVQAQLMREIAIAYRGLGLYDRALRFARQSLDIRRRVLGPRHPDTAISLTELATALRLTSTYDDALAAARESVAIRRALYPPDDPRLAAGLTNLGIALEDKAEYEEAEQVHREAVRIRRLHAAADPRALATSLGNLAGVLDRRGATEELGPMLSEVLELRRQALGPEHVEVAQALNNLGNHYRARGELDRAEQAFRDVLAMRRKILGDDHPDVAKALHNVASPLTLQRRYSEAIPLLEEALRIFTARLGPEHLNTAFTLESLAHVHFHKGDYEAAAPLYRRSADIFRATFGPDHPETALALYNLAGNCISQGLLDEAERHVRRAEQILRARLGPRHPSILRAMSRYGDILHERRRYTEAIAKFEEILEAAKPNWRAEEEADYNSAVAGLGAALLGAGRAAEAEPHLQSALALYRKILPAGDLRVPLVESLLGECLLELGRRDEAARLLTASHAALRAGYGDRNPAVQRAKARLARLEAAR